MREPEVNWCHVFSWSKSESLKTSIEDFVAIDSKQLDLASLASFLEPNIVSSWEKRNWHDFDYLSVEPPTWAVVLIWIMSAVATIVSSVLCVTNQYESESTTRDFDRLGKWWKRTSTTVISWFWRG